MIRPESSPAQVDSGAKIIRVKESGGSVYRMKWNGGAYVVTTDAVQIFEDSGLTPLVLDASEERLAFWRPAAKRYEVCPIGEEGPPGDGALFADFTATARSARTSDTITADINAYWGGTPGSTTGVTVNKLSDHDVTIESGDKFRGVWDTTEEEWKLFWFDGLRLTVSGTVSNGGSDVTPATSTFTLTSPALVNGWRLPASLTVTNDPPLYVAEGTTIKARFNLTLGTDPTTNWDTGDSGNFLYLLKGIGGYNEGGDIQFVANETGNDNPDWISPDSYSGGDEQVLSHNTVNDLEWMSTITLDLFVGTLP